MPNYKKILAGLTGGIYISDQALSLKGKTLLHISDTPLMLFSSLKKVIAVLQPDYIVHTGDMVDNIKLEMYPFRLDDYKKSLKKLGRILNEYPHIKLYIASGNHDDIESIRRLFDSADIVENLTEITVEGRHFAISHYPPDMTKLDQKVSVSFFGHDLSISSHIENDTIYLNGIEHLSLIELDTLKVVQLNYPAGTNDSRLNKRKIGM